MTGAALLSASDVAEFVGVTPETVLGYFRAGELPGYRLGKVGGRVRFRQEHVDAWLERSRVNVPAPPAAMTPGQNGKLHAKLEELAALCGLTRRELKEMLLARVSREFGREITSSRELCNAEASWAIDEVVEAIERAVDRPLTGETAGAETPFADRAQ